MKKTGCIRLVLITAALAACNRPMYQQEYYTPGYYPDDLPDSTNSCPIEYSNLPLDYYNWMYGFRFYPYPMQAHRGGFGGKIHAAGA
jgi:hypothetical protein